MTSTLILHFPAFTQTILTSLILAFVTCLSVYSLSLQPWQATPVTKHSQSITPDIQDTDLTKSRPHDDEQTPTVTVYTTMIPTATMTPKPSQPPDAQHTTTQTPVPLPPDPAIQPPDTNADHPERSTMMTRSKVRNISLNLLTSPGKLTHRSSPTPHLQSSTRRHPKRANEPRRRRDYAAH